MRFFICLLLLITNGCALAGRQNTTPASPYVRSQVEKIKSELTVSSSKKNIGQLEIIAREHEGTDAGAEASFLLAQQYFKTGDYTSSYRAYLNVLNSKYTSPYENDSQLGAALSLYRLGRFDECLIMTQQALNGNDLALSRKIEIQTLRYNTLVALGDRKDALKSLVFLSENVPDPELKSRYKIKAQEFVDTKLRAEDLIAVASDTDYGFVRNQALLVVGTAYFEQKDYSRAENAFRDLVSYYPNTDNAAIAQQRLEQIDARRKVEPYTIGAVLPLSGKHASVAQKTLRGLQMGLGITGEFPSDFKLAVVDSTANPDVARRGVERLIVEDHAIAVVGDLISKTAEPVAKKSDELGVPIIGLSQKAGLTRIGDNVFRNALTSASIVKELVYSAIEKNGHKKFAILYPNDAYGVEYANLFWDEVLARGGEIVGAQTYSPDEHDFNNAISRLVGTYYIEDRSDEYFQRVQEWYSQQKVITSRVTPPTDILPPVIDFDALFIPDGVKALGQVASMLLYSDITGVRLMGTNLWNSPSLIERGTKLIENSLFVDAQSSISTSYQKTPFAEKYRSLYKEEPSVFEAQAYDTGLVLRNLITSGAKSRTALRSSLAQLSEFNGSLGKLTVTPEREFTRPLSVLTVTEGQIGPAKDPIKTQSN